MPCLSPKRRRTRTGRKMLPGATITGGYRRRHIQRDRLPHARRAVRVASSAALYREELLCVIRAARAKSSQILQSVD